MRSDRKARHKASARHGILGWFAASIFAMLAAAIAISVAPVAAQTPLSMLCVSPDITVALTSGTVTPQQVQCYSFSPNSAAAISFPGINPGMNVTGYFPLSATQTLLTIDTTAALPTDGVGGTVKVTPRDVASYNPFTGSFSPTLYFSGVSNGIPVGTGIDAIGMDGSGHLILSFDVAINVAKSGGGMLTVKPADLVSFDGAAFALLFDSFGAGIPDGMNLDGATMLSNTNLLMAFDVAGSIGGTDFTPVDVLEFNPGANSSVVSFDGDTADNWPDGSMIHGVWAAGAGATPFATPVPTATSTATPTASATPTATATATATANPTTTATATATDTATATETATATDTATATATATVTATPTATPTPGLANSAWPMFHQNLLHTGRSPYDTSANNGKLKWAFPTGGDAEGSPVIGADGTIYIGVLLFSSGAVYAVNPDGTQKWMFPTGGGVQSAPAISTDGTLYVGSNDHKLYAINPDGSQKWTFQTGGSVSLSSPSIGADGTIYFGSLDGNTYAVTDGGQGVVTQKWAFATGTGDTSSPAIGADGTIYVGSNDSNLYALTDGGPGVVSLKWKFLTGNDVTASPAIGADGTIYVGSNDSHLYAINPSDGSQKWALEPGLFLASSPAIGANGTIYLGSDDKNVYAVTDNGNHGTLKWAFTTGNVVHSSPAIGRDGTIFVGSDDWNLYALTDGGQGVVTQKWLFATNNLINFSSPAIGADGTIYIGSGDGNLYAINGVNPTPTPTSTVTSTATATVTATATATVTATVTSTPSATPTGCDPSTGFGCTPTPTPTATPTTSVLVPTSLAFGNSPVGDPVTKNLTVKNTGHALLFINNLSFGGAVGGGGGSERVTPFNGAPSNPPPGDFSALGTNCPSGGLAPGLSCTINIAFTPRALGLRTATLFISDNTATSPQHVALSGTGTIDMTVTPTSFSIGKVMDGMKVVKTVTVANKQTNSVSLSEGFSGANASDFSITGGNCTGMLAAKTSCTLTVTFGPTAVGGESAVMTVTDSPDPLGPYTVSFSASATIPESLSATKLLYGNVAQTASKTLSITVTNKASSGPITLTGTSIGGANAGDFAVTGGSCGASLAALSSCTYAVKFTPSTETVETASLSIGVAEDPNGGPPAVSLSGTGVTPLKAVPTSLAFGTIAGGHSSTNKTVTVTNNGGVMLTISESITGPNASDFAVTGGTCGAMLAGGGAHCTYTLKFTPTIVGAESATLAVSAVGDAASPHNVSLGGTGG